MTPSPVTITLTLVMVAVLLAAGCSDGKYVQEQDIELIKINPDGMVA